MNRRLRYAQRQFMKTSDTVAHFELHIRHVMFVSKLWALVVAAVR